MKQAIDFLIDISDKMDKKLSITQKVLTEELIPNLRDSDITGMRTFLSIVHNPIIINSLDLASNSKADFMQKASSLPIPNGGTPLADVVKESREGLAKVDADKKCIVLITAGEETEGGNYMADAERAGKDVQVNIIGIGMRDEDITKAQSVAKASGGFCCNIPAEKFADNAAIREAVSPIVDVLKGLAASPAPEPKPQPAPAPEPEPEPVAAKVESKPAPAAEPVKKEEPKAAATASTPEPAKKAPTPTLSKVDTAPIEGVCVGNSCSTAAIDNALPKMKENQKAIAELLDKNIEILRQTTAASDDLKKENADLRKAESKNLETIQKLNDKVNEAGDTIEKLKAIITDKDEEISALNINKKDLMVTISQWQERDRNVIIDLDAKEREETSRASEEILFEFLEKKYPGRVKWCNQNKKDAKGYDFEITGYENNETEYFIACKGAKDDKKTFFLTQKEWNACLENSLNYQVYLIRNVGGKPKIILVDNLIGWLTTGKVMPGALKNEKVKAGQVMLTLV